MKGSKVTEEHVLKKHSLSHLLQVCCEGGSSLLDHAEVKEKLLEFAESIDVRHGVPLVKQILQYIKLVTLQIKQVNVTMRICYVNFCAVVSGLEIRIKIWVSIQKICLNIWISPSISGFPTRKPQFKTVRQPENSWLSGRKPWFKNWVSVTTFWCPRHPET